MLFDERRLPNRVHMLVTPHAVTACWLGPLEGFTAHEVNRILGSAGRPFWQDESWHHAVRDGPFDRIRQYIE
jgi:REP element-mobilizing transposase RayT